MSNDIVEFKKRYDNECEMGSTCTVSINIDKKMEKTVHIYYELHNFHQNHRIYMKSLSRDQLEGKEISKSDAESSCDPVPLISDFCKFLNNILANRHTSLLSSHSGDDVAHPCGLIAKSYFQGKF